MLNIEKYKDDILNAKQAHLTCSIYDIFLKLSHISCTGNCKECKKNIMNWLLEEYKEPILDEVEKEYLSAVIKPFRDRVISVRKYHYDKYYEYITIIYYDVRKYLSIYFPPFKKGTMYKGMELDRNYTLEELGL